MLKKLTKKQKIAVLGIVALIVAAVIVGVTFLGLYLGGAIGGEPTVGELRTKDADNGYKKHYTEGGIYPGTYAVMTINDGKRDYVWEILLMPEYAPITVNNFITYVEEGFYDGTVIHRIVADTFTFQGGGYTYNNETKNYSAKTATHEKINGEFSSNPVGDYSYNKLSHFAGTISMARTSNKNSATTEFFFSWSNYPKWDGDYAAFGFIVDSADVREMKQLATTTRINADTGYPESPITITKVEIVKVETGSEVIG